MQELYSPLCLSAFPNPAADVPTPLPEDDATRRAISTFDRTTTVDSHKVGVLYIGDRQSSEAEILANVMGSADYTSFVTSLGTLTRLKGATFNTQGLDRESDTDGEFTMAWRDRVTELVFHIATMMPTDLERDPAGTKGETASIDTKSITSSSAPISEEGASNQPEHVHRPSALLERFYRIQVLSAPDFPAISPASTAKIISGKALPDFVRCVALNASVFSLVWANREGGEHVSSWRNRLREIKRLKEKYGVQEQRSPRPEPIARPPSTPLVSGSERNSVIGAVGSLIGIGGDRRPASVRDSGTILKRASAI